MPGARRVRPECLCLLQKHDAGPESRCEDIPSSAKPASDMLDGLREVAEGGLGVPVQHGGAGLVEEGVLESGETAALAALKHRSEERRVGKECRSRWST